MLKKRYWTYTQRFIIDWEFTQDESLNGYYDLSFFLNYPKYQLPTLTIKDWLCNNKFFIAEYDENILTEQNINDYIASIPNEFNIKLLATEEAKEFMRWYYKEETPWYFILSEEIEMMWETIPKKYLIIE